MLAVLVNLQPPIVFFNQRLPTEHVIEGRLTAEIVPRNVVQVRSYLLLATHI